jgi:hypothetical protein
MFNRGIQFKRSIKPKKIWPVLRRVVSFVTIFLMVFMYFYVPLEAINQNSKFKFIYQPEINKALAQGTQGVVVRVVYSDTVNTLAGTNDMSESGFFGSWTVPTGVTTVNVSCWGAGGGGGDG